MLWTAGGSIPALRQQSKHRASARRRVFAPQGHLDASFLGRPPGGFILPPVGVVRRDERTRPARERSMSSRM